MSYKGTTGIKPPITDTIPQKQYFVVMRVPTNDWIRVIDTTNLIMNNFGKSLSVDAADAYRTVMARQLNRLAQTITIDSVEISKPKK
jgi:hypothetical protein